MTTLREKLVNKAINRALGAYEHQLTCAEIKGGNIRLWDSWEGITLRFDHTLDALSKAESAMAKGENPYEIFWAAAKAYRLDRPVKD